MYFSVIRPVQKHVRDAAYERIRATRRARAEQMYELHQWLWHLFPDSSTVDGKFIFREYLPANVQQKNTEQEYARDFCAKLSEYYVVSKKMPDSGSLGPGWQVQTRAYDPQIELGQCFSFELRANPVVSREDAQGKKQRHDVVMDAKKRLLQERGLSRWQDWKGVDRPELYTLVQQEGTRWLERQGARCGFDVLNVTVNAYQPRVMVRKKDRNGNIQNLSVTTMDFAGQLRVTDAEAFRQTLFGGLGHARGLGCGLLLIKRIKG